MTSDNCAAATLPAVEDTAIIYSRGHPPSASNFLTPRNLNLRRPTRWTMGGIRLALVTKGLILAVFWRLEIPMSTYTTSDGGRTLFRHQSLTTQSGLQKLLDMTPAPRCQVPHPSTADNQIAPPAPLPVTSTGILRRVSSRVEMRWASRAFTVQREVRRILLRVATSRKTSLLVRWAPPGWSRCKNPPLACLHAYAYRQ
jgi:hypothetical protein